MTLQTIAVCVCVCVLLVVVGVVCVCVCVCVCVWRGHAGTVTALWLWRHPCADMIGAVRVRSLLLPQLIPAVRTEAASLGLK